MINQPANNFSPFLIFEREQWAALRKSVPLSLTEQDLKPLLSFNEELSLDEVRSIYLPLVRLLNYYIEENLQRHTVIQRFLDIDKPKIPYIISIAGSVAVGKSTTARILQALLTEENRRVDLITTDGFLYPLEKLKQLDLLGKKGFPVSYDTHALIQFVSDIKSGKQHVKAPVYSHLIYDIIPNKFTEINQPDILIIEGLNVLQRSHKSHNLFVSDFVDFSIFVDAEETLLKSWYIKRFLKFRKGAFADPNSYFHHYAKLTEQEAIEIASHIWDTINGVNLHENILPTRERASLILVKGEDHAINTVKLRK
ncbi:type I pantothenate kinase [Gallibacterium melopsittaci]|uniref:Pantothenate kinase n=1 Tax=Gallibacterium melopsittaci TaxID=516063 RepID=A0ABV6HXB2_9PAST